MIKGFRYLLFGLLALTLTYLTGCSSTGDSNSALGHKTTSDKVFPVPRGVENNVEFWRQVYGEWSRSQIAFHDNLYMGVIYEVAEVPGAYRGSAENRRAFIRGKQEEYRGRLVTLERKVASGESLTAADKVLYDKLVAAGGKSAVHGAAERLRTQQGVRERFLNGMEISGRYDQAFREIFRKHGVPEDLAYLPHVESSFQAKARSGVGAAGLWQFMPATGRIYQLQVDSKLDHRMDPMLAAEGAARYLADAHRKLGSWPLAVTSYNHGQGGMAKAKRLYGDDIGVIVQNYKGEYFGFDSRNFYSQFVAAREVAGNADRYFPEGVAYHKPHDHDRLVLKHPMPAHHLASHYGLSVFHLDDLNPSWNKPIVQGGAQIPAGNTVWLPAGTTKRVSNHPAPAPVMIAMAEPKPVSRPTLAKADTKTTTKAQPVLAKADTKSGGKTQPVLAKTNTKSGAKAGPTLAKADTKTATKARPTLAKADPKSGAKATPAVAKVPPKTHVVKANETLYRVAVMYETSVDEIKKLNKMNSSDNTIRAGQKLRVSG